MTSSSPALGSICLSNIVGDLTPGVGITIGSGVDTVMGGSPSSSGGMMVTS